MCYLVLPLMSDRYSARYFNCLDYSNSKFTIKRNLNENLQIDVLTLLTIGKAVMIDRDVHIWEMDLQQTEEQIQKLSQYLNDREHQRAAKFINPLHRDRWTVARGSLRQILSQYVDLTPEQIVFSYGAQGKPEIEGNPIQFNLSHSHDRAVCAISAKYPVGIDLEYIHPIDAAGLVDRFFSRSEQAIFHALPVSQQQAAFFHAWTQKEAYLKACGTGLSTPLDRIEVSIDPDTPAQIVSAPIAGIWQIQKLEISPEYAGAIVSGGHVSSIEYLKLDPLDS
jgi:4'-phosphopantetheinyl transferase